MFGSVRNSAQILRRILQNGMRSGRRHTWASVIPATTEVNVGNKSVQIGTGKLARFADGCAVVTIGDTSVMVTAVGKSKTFATNFVPLTVDYRQKAAAAGRIPTNYMRREMGVSEHEVLTSRMIDRSVRPLFPVNFPFDTQLVCNVLAMDGYHDPEIASINAASAALALSDIPWNGPVGAVRVGIVDGEILVNPSRQEMANSSLNLIITGCAGEKIVMLESTSENIPTNLFQKAIKQGLRHVQSIVAAINNLSGESGKEKRELSDISEVSDSEKELTETLQSMTSTHIKEILTDSRHDKFSRDNALTKVKDDALLKLKEHYPDLDTGPVIEMFYALVKTIFRDLVFETNIRCDGRKLTDVRPIQCEADLYKPLHGSALFQRGQTQVLCTVTFDSPDSATRLDPITAITSGIKEKNFFLLYEFPPYATNETGRPGAVGRRELGHGALAERALRPVVPSNYPFTIRLTAEVLESNGSSSMASVCSGSLALMDAGVPILEPAVGVAMGLLTRYDGDNLIDHRILTDLLGIEDYMGDMDFKIAGTKSGVTALQADIKIPGMPLYIVNEAIEKATEAKKHILNIMNQCRRSPRAQPKPNAPVLEKLDIPIIKRSKFVGIGGMNLKKLQQKTGVTINQIDENAFQIFAPNQMALAEAKEMIEELLIEDSEPVLEFGAIYKAKITEVRDSGVMVQLFPTMVPTLIHNSQLDTRKVKHPSVLDLQIGQEIDVKYFGRDPANGKMRLSRRAMMTAGSGLMKNLIQKP